jgi:ATP-dependent Clp protease ATP-binding subunit ClpA
VANHAKDTGKSVRELVGNEKDDNEVENSHSKGEAEKEGTEADQPPVKLLDKKKVRGLADTLKARVFGQDKTINEVVGVLKIAALNIKINEAKPAGCYFFAGPSGVGKTELAQSIADQLGVKLLKINMGEYSQEQDVSKLIGTAKGLVGYKEGGLLTNFVKKNPACVVLFDEIEKADPSMDNILLSIMDHGECGANDGSTVAFKDTIVISTSNLGADVEYYQDMSKEEKDTLRMAYIKDGLRPEIINRYDSIFHFNALTPEIYKMVASKFLNKLSSSMVEQHGFNIKFSPQLVDFMIDKSYDPAMGGRPARKFIEKIIIQPLADYMLEDEFEEHKEITMDLNKSGKICFKGKNRKILGVLENTEELVAEFEAGKFTNKTTKSAKP